MSHKVRHFDRQNEIHGYSKNKKMNDEVYALRRQVIDIIYRAKKFVDLPRIDVRITEPHKGSHSRVLGTAYLGCNIIYIPENTLRLRKAYLQEIVLHEIVHAVTSFEHDPNCPLMSPSIGTNPMIESKMWECFVKYFEKGEK